METSVPRQRDASDSALVDMLMLEAPIGLALFGTDLRFRWVNAALTRLDGHAEADPSSYAGRRPAEVWPVRVRAGAFGGGPAAPRRGPLPGPEGDWPRRLCGLTLIASQILTCGRYATLSCPLWFCLLDGVCQPGDLDRHSWTAGQLDSHARRA